MVRECARDHAADQTLGLAIRACHRRLVGLPLRRRGAGPEVRERPAAPDPGRLLGDGEKGTQVGVRGAHAVRLQQLGGRAASTTKTPATLSHREHA